MLKLMKYEFRKNRTALLVIGSGLLLLQLYYMFGCFTESDTHLGAGAALLILWSVVCFFTVFILAVTNYSRELNSKSSYLIFMTPNTSFSIIFSKMLTILLMGTAIALVFGALTILDIELLHARFPEMRDFLTLLNLFLEDMDIHMGQALLGAFSWILIFLVDFFSAVSVAYLSITLSATYLQNSRIKGLISVAVFLLATFVLNRLAGLLPLLYEQPRNMTESFLAVLPVTAFNLAVLVLCIFICGKLLDKKLSL